MAAEHTRRALLDAAERLYAERGLDAVSLREIAAAAGQRNNAAVHYHFGGRDALVRAVFERRFALLEARRAALLAELDARGAGGDVRSLVAILTLPFAESLDGSGGHWVRFVARLHEDARYNPFGSGAPYAAGADAIATTAELSRRIKASLDLPADVLDARFYLVTTMAVHAVADREALLAAGGGAAVASTPLFLAALVDAATAVLTAPPGG